ncbi:hypothetical protein [Kineosporia babensis]|uniref:Uncharacterized protein n=1 Tax=Kineosporia babensis TaxID=499548 RepID=A0A9X1SUG9_9ACTN|nr:hypothetical protein [Kineosporia babensis]MCD5312957.1 hypothetical protein [Kineosporia babensis]
MIPTRGAIRLTRAAMFSLSAAGLAIAAHAAGGEAVSLPVALACVPAVMLVVNLLAARRRGPVSLVLAMAGTQFLLHAALMAADLAAGCRMSAQHLSSLAAAGPGSASAATASGHTAVTTATCDATAMAGHQASDMFTMSPRMFAAHALSATLLALLLAKGEAAIWALTSSLSFRLTLPRIPELPPARRALPVLVREALLPQADVPRQSVRRRGPPALVPRLYPC